MEKGAVFFFGGPGGSRDEGGGGGAGGNARMFVLVWGRIVCWGLGGWEN